MQSQTELVRIIKDAFREDGLPENQLEELAFHLTDWITDLHAFTEVIDSPGNLSSEEIRRRIIALLVHAPDHLQAAADIILGLRDD